MRVLHVITINGYGGAEKLLLHLLPALQEGNVSAECLILNKKGVQEFSRDIGSKLLEKGIKVHYGEYSSILDREALKKIKQIINAGNYNIIHSHLKYVDVWMTILKKTGGLKLPVVTTLHGYNDEYENEYGFSITKRIYFSVYYWVTKIICHSLDGFILISQIVADFYHGTNLLEKGKGKIIYHGYALKDNKYSEEKYAEKQNGPILAIPGRILKRKGHVFAIRALKELLIKWPDASLYIFGTGPYEPVLRKLIEEEGVGDSIIFSGYVDPLVSYLRGCDIVVIPSLWEGFGIVFLDAFAAERPVVAFDLPAGNEIIQHKINGLLASPGDSKSLADMISLLWEDKKLKETITHNATIKLINEFSIKKMAEKYLSFYSTLQ